VKAVSAPSGAGASHDIKKSNSSTKVIEAARVNIQKYPTITFFKICMRVIMQELGYSAAFKCTLPETTATDEIGMKRQAPTFILFTITHLGSP
jgi:hypothetical protein